MKKTKKTILSPVPPSVPKTLLVLPTSRLMANGLPNPKNYPLFADVVRELRERGVYCIQVGISTDVSVGCHERVQDQKPEDIWDLALRCDGFLSVDSFFPHMAQALREEYAARHGHAMPGVVVWMVTDHQHFGYPEHKHVYSGKPTMSQCMLLPMEAVAEEFKEKGVNGPPHDKIVDAVMAALS